MSSFVTRFDAAYELDHVTDPAKLWERVTGYGIRVTGYGIRVTGYGLQVSGCGLGFNNLIMKISYEFYVGRNFVWGIIRNLRFIRCHLAWQ
jgi:hypothetical protein